MVLVGDIQGYFELTERFLTLQADDGSVNLFSLSIGKMFVSPYILSRYAGQFDWKTIFFRHILQWFRIQGEKGIRLIKTYPLYIRVLPENRSKSISIEEEEKDPV